VPGESYREAADQLAAEIKQGVYPYGEPFPSSRAIQARYGAGETFARSVLGVLRADGWIRAVKNGGGYMVRQLPVIRRDAAGRFRDREAGGARGAFAAELAAMGLESRSDTEVSHGQAPEDVADLLGILPGGDAVVRARKMYAGDVPVQIAVSWLSAALVSGTAIEEADTGTGGTYSRLADLGHAVTEFEETVMVRRPDDDEAAFLEIDPDQRVFVIRRVALDVGQVPVEVTDSVIAVHQWELVYRWPAG
jgi:GntR family transcriptional regulator